MDTKKTKRVHNSSPGFSEAENERSDVLTAKFILKLNERLKLHIQSLDGQLPPKFYDGIRDIVAEVWAIVVELEPDGRYNGKSVIEDDGAISEDRRGRSNINLVDSGELARVFNMFVSKYKEKTGWNLPGRAKGILEAIQAGGNEGVYLDELEASVRDTANPRKNVSRGVYWLNHAFKEYNVPFEIESGTIYTLRRRE